MKATMVFILPEEKTDFTLAINGSKMYCILWEFDQWLRGEIKYNDKEYNGRNSLITADIWC